MKQKSALFEIQLNSISNTDNPTKKEVEFLLHDFSLSKNNTFISKETAQKAFESLESTPIVAKYYENSDVGSDDDALGGHEATIGVTRDGENYYVELQTTPIGVFTEPAYIKTIEDENGDEKEVVAGKGVLWSSRFPNVIGLLQQWIDEGITVSSSMEILYDEYLFKDGTEEILNFVYEGHCVLNSSERGEHKKVEPAYDVSKLTRLVAEAMNQSNEEDGKVPEKFKKVFELSHDDIRSKLYQELDATLGKREYSWIADVYDNYFVANVYSFAEDNEYDKFFKFEYTSTEDNVEIDQNSKVEVFLKRNWEEVVPEEVQQQLNEKDEKIESLRSEKETIQGKFNEASEKLTSLNSTVEELSEYKEKFEQAQFEEKFEEKQELYSAKFSALGAIDKFESEEVQGLIEKAVNDVDAEVQLNSMIVDLIEIKKESDSEDNPIIQLNNERKDLVPTETDFDSRYK